MKSTVETVSPTQVRLEIEVPFSELQPSIDAAYRAISQQISVPGFRKGKVPPRLVDQRVGRAAVLQESINSAVPGLVAKAVEENNLRVLGAPDIDLTELNDGESIKLTADIEVRPELELPDIEALEITVDEVKPDENAVEEELNRLRERFATLKSVTRPVADGDYIGIDLHATADGEELEGGSAKSITYRVGKGDLLEGLDEAVRGLSSGEDATFHTTLVGGEHAGKEADVEVTVRSVKEQELPEADDEFAQAASEFDTLEELRTQLAEQVERSTRLRQVNQARERAVDALLAGVEVPLPERVVTREVEGNKQQLTGYLKQLGLDFGNYLESQGKTEEEFDANLRTDAEKSVRAQLALDALAESEEIGITDAEITAEVVRRAQQAQVDPQQFADHLVQSRQLGMVAADIRREKALLLVVESAKVTDTAGEKVDVKSLIRPEKAEAPADAVAAAAE